MQILELRVVNFRRFDDVELSFAEGMNLVRGPNESGKSTLVLALMAGLFVRPQTDTALAKSYMRWGNDETPLVEIHFSHDGSRFHLVKDFGARTVSLEEEGEAPLRSMKAINAKISELIGFSDPAKYMRTACVTHDQMVSLAEDSTGAKKLANMLREVVVGGRESILMENAVKKLSAEVDGLKRGLERPTSNPGTIKRLVDEREALIFKQRELSERLAELENQRERLNEVEGLLAENEPELKQLTELLEQNRKIGELERRAEEARAKFASVDRVNDARIGLDRINEKIDTDCATFRSLEPGAEEELRKVMDWRASLSEFRGELAIQPPEEEAPVAEPGPRPGIAWVGIGAGAFIALLGIVLGAALNAALFSLIALGLVIAAAAFFIFRAPEPVVPDMPALLGDRIRQTDLEIERLEAREREFLESVGSKDAEEFFSSYREYQALLSERERAAAGLKALIAGRASEEVERERRQASLDAAALEEQQRELEQFRIEPAGLSALASDHDALLKEVESLRKERDNLTFHLLKTADDPEDATRIEEELTWLWEAEQAARRRLRVYTIARDATVRTAESLLSSAVPVLSESVGRTFAALTDGHYDRVQVREGDLGLSVYSPERGGMVPAEELLSSLSKGTASQLYLAARLELVGLLSGGRKPPLIFDDSFSYFDDHRLELLWNVLLEVARDQQVIVLTCTDRYDGLTASGVNVIDLDR